MAVFNQGLTLEQLNQMCANNMLGHLGIEFTGITENSIEARMPVDHRTHQPFGILHGGASVTLAETLGSVAATYCIDNTTQFCVGLEINANHIKSVRDGFVIGCVKPIHIGKKTQIWEIKITTEKDELVCVSRITMAILDKR